MLRDFTIELKARQGELARVASALAREHLTLKAGVALTVGPRIVARFVPSDVDAARRALDAADVRFVESDVIPVLLEARPGELAMLSAKLATGGVNVRAVYVTGINGSVMEVAVAADNVARAQRALE